ncbi:replicative DNA helicase [Faecalicoccus acidiformans]|uniref:Replicative DNA helicase n=1 Tax=Faecalicoccus acidiformans TaxID=915173 RepID=A0A7W8D192_9FIRM|nr:replicative DNA helicase [Faecalicoccus acidiformans]MBB5185116.1 replicative DNA helicase [Faecalicoccus acidiformans]MBM6830575.1 replicative DNA helicase [Faecalicoccus acidiformans]MDM8203011.1 replicative DNA helicase [Faecalicoccus acidiformans]HIW18630.1 replicative DNA helicase [Candidatus Faecalicoccus intestinipullorum]
MVRELPNSQPLEQALLGSLMIYPSVMQECMDLDLQPIEFYLPAHQRLFACMQEIVSTGQRIDLNLVLTRLKDKEELESVGGTDYIIRLQDSAISSANTRNYIESIKNSAQLRRLIFAAEKISNESYDASEDIDTILDEAEREIMEVTRQRRGAEFESSQTVINRVMNQLMELRNKKGVTGIRTGYVELDKITNGFQRGDLIILAARPAMGKSALALNFANEVSKLNEGAVAVFSLEMPADSLMKRLLSSESQVPSNKLRDGKLTDAEMSRLNFSGSQLGERNLFIDDTSSIKVSQIFSKCRKLKNEYGSLSLIVIDYLQLITGNRADSRQQEVSDISRNLKILAKELDCPVIALSQLARKVEDRSDHAPQLSDLRESGSIEQDADIVMFIYREDYYKKEEEESKDDTSVVDLSLAKHRNGALGHINLVFEKNISRFTNFSNQSEDIYAG